MTEKHRILLNGLIFTYILQPKYTSTGFQWLMFVCMEEEALQWQALADLTLSSILFNVFGRKTWNGENGGSSTKRYSNKTKGFYTEQYRLNTSAVLHILVDNAVVKVYIKLLLKLLLLKCNQLAFIMYILAHPLSITTSRHCINVSRTQRFSPW